jgi:translocator protein
MGSMTSPTTDTPAARPTWKPWVGLVVFVALAFAAGGLGAAGQGSDVGGRYLALDRPAWAPPQEAFGIVWPVLYVFIGVAAWRVWKTAGSVPAAGVALGLWAAQLVVNAVWPAVFFGSMEFGWAVPVIVTLDALVVATIVAFRRHDRLGAWLLVPYLVWILYATALNVALWLLN